MRQAKFLIWHCLGTPEGREVSKETLLGWFLNPKPLGNGWERPGYRTFIHLDGTKDDLIDYNNDGIIQESEITNGAYGWNRNAIHKGYVGGCDRRMNPKDTRTDYQREMMIAATFIEIGYNPDIKIGGHNQFNKRKACPAFDVPDWLEYIGVPEKNILRQNLSLLRTTKPKAMDFNKRIINT